MEIVRSREVVNHHQNQALQNGLYLLVIFNENEYGRPRLKMQFPNLMKILDVFYDFRGNNETYIRTTKHGHLRK